MPFSSVSSALIVAASGKSSGGGLAAFLPLLLILAVGYFFLVRPARNRQRQAMQTRSNVTPGAEVTTTAGLIATVVSVDDEEGTVTLEVAPGVYSKYVKAAIGRVNTPIEPMDGSHEQIDADTTEPPSNGSASFDKPDPDSPER